MPVKHGEEIQRQREREIAVNTFVANVVGTICQTIVLLRVSLN